MVAAIAGIAIGNGTIESRILTGGPGEARRSVRFYRNRPAVGLDGRRKEPQGNNLSRALACGRMVGIRVDGTTSPLGVRIVLLGPVVGRLFLELRQIGKGLPGRNTARETTTTSR